MFVVFIIFVHLLFLCFHPSLGVMLKGLVVCFMFALHKASLILVLLKSQSAAAVIVGRPACS